MTDTFCTKLPNRASIVLRGADKVAFLQGLITQDLDYLEQQSLIYACHLTAQGKFLFDFFIRRNDEDLVIDCEGLDRAEALLKRLSMYKLRSNVQLDLIDNTDVWQIWGANCNEGMTDPRHVSCGNKSYSKPQNIEEVSFQQWDIHRIQLEIPDGSRDLIPEQSFIHEGRLDKLNAVSYTKGCYIGQELVSRMHHRGLTKKILRCFDLDSLPEKSELRSSCKNFGLALVRI